MNVRERQQIATALMEHKPPSFAALARMQEVFELTTAEVRLMGLLATGYGLDEAAQIMRCSIESVRSYSKRIYEKTDAHSQSRVVCLVLKAESTAA